MSFFSKSSSKSTISTVNEVITNVSSKISSACGASNVTTQSITQIAAGDVINTGDVEQSADATINLSCKITSSMDQKFKDEVKAQLNQALAAKTSGISLGSKSKTETNISEVVRAVTDIDLENIQSCLASNETTQSLTQIAGGSIVNQAKVSQSSVSKVIGDCLLSNTTLVEASKALDSTIANDQTAATTGFDPFQSISDMFSNIAGAFSGNSTASAVSCVVSSCLVCVLLIVGAVIFFKTQGSSDPAAATPSMPSSAPSSSWNDAPYYPPTASMPTPSSAGVNKWSPSSLASLATPQNLATMGSLMARK